MFAALFDEGVEADGECGHAVAQVVEAEGDAREGVGHAGCGGGGQWWPDSRRGQRGFKCRGHNISAGDVIKDASCWSVCGSEASMNELGVSRFEIVEGQNKRGWPDNETGLASWVSLAVDFDMRARRITSAQID